MQQTDGTGQPDELMNSYGKTFHTWMTNMHGEKDDPRANR